MEKHDHYFWEECEECGESVAILTNSLQAQGILPVICDDCAWLYRDDDEDEYQSEPIDDTPW